MNDRVRQVRGDRRGVTALIAMLFLIVISVLALVMFRVAGTNVQTSANFADLARAQAAAESGLRWTAYRFATMDRPRELAGTVTPAIAYDVWNRPNGLRQRLAANFAQARDRANVAIGVSAVGDTVRTTTPVPTDVTGATFDVVVRQLGAPDGSDARFVRVTSTGRYRNAVRSVAMNFEIEKRIKFAVVGKVPIQLGRNTLIEGPIGMVTPSKFPPVLVLSDFTHFHAGLKTKVEGFEAYLKGTSSVNGQTIKNHNGFDNRISVNNAPEYAAARAAGYKDVNGDAYIDEYDLFVEQFDANRDGAISRAEFTNPSTGKLYEPNLFAAIDGLSPPLVNEDRNNNHLLDYDEDANNNGKLDVDPPRLGYGDGILDNRDAYSKITGQVLVAATAGAWQSNINASSPGKTINDFQLGGVAPSETGEQTIKFGATGNELLDLDPADFEEAANNLRNATGSGGGAASKLTGRIENTVLSPADVSLSPPYVKVTTAGGTALKVGDVVPQTTFDAANAAARAAGKTAAAGTAPPTTVDEATPYGSTSHQATYRRPVFRGVAFKNVRIPKGMNALFENCTFEGVTFVEVERDVRSPGGSVTTSKDDGMTWAKRMKSGSFNADTALTAANSYGFEQGNNLRFNNCTFEGPISSNYATAYTHFANSWEFTNSTYFNNKWIDPRSMQTTATIVGPQTNIEMGSFTDPNAAPSTLVGVVVAGNIDIRGTSYVDGSIIVTGDGAGNTTLGYFGASDGDTNPAPMTEQGGAFGYGRLHVRYNPFRNLPDGINIPVLLSGRPDTYREGTR